MTTPGGVSQAPREGSSPRWTTSWWSEEDGPIVDIESLLARCDYFSLSRPQAVSVLAEVHSAVSQWRGVASSPLVGMQAYELEDFAAAFEHDQLSAAARMLRS